MNVPAWPLTSAPLEVIVLARPLTAEPLDVIVLARPLVKEPLENVLVSPMTEKTLECTLACP